MINKRIQINDNAYFDTYLWDNSAELKPEVKRPVVVVCPGGAYQYTSDREAEPIALAFASQGYHAVVLRYSIGIYGKFPQPLKDLAFTMEYLYDHADEMYIDKSKIFVAGLSAGGHLAAALGTLWNNKEFLPEYSDRAEKIRPAGMILGYPVIDLRCSTEKLDIGLSDKQEFEDIQFGTVYPGYDLSKIYYRKDGKTLINFRNAMNAFIFGGEFTEEQEEHLCLQQYVSEETIPAFIWHGRYDGLIYPMNSLRLVNELYKYNIQFEFHIFGYGDHGLGLANAITQNNPWEVDESCEQWLNLAFTWVKRMCTDNK